MFLGVSVSVTQSCRMEHMMHKGRYWKSGFSLMTMLATGIPCLCACSQWDPSTLRFDGFEDESVAAFWRPGSSGSGRYEAGAVVISEEYALRAVDPSRSRSRRAILSREAMMERAQSGPSWIPGSIDSSAPMSGTDSLCSFLRRSRLSTTDWSSHSGNRTGLVEARSSRNASAKGGTT